MGITPGPGFSEDLRVQLPQRRETLLYNLDLNQSMVWHREQASFA